MSSSPVSAVPVPLPASVAPTVIPVQNTLAQHARAFVLGALAACGAVTFTNPWEVVKTRLQLQGELESKAKLAASTSTTPLPTRPHPYNNAFSGLLTIFRNEGIRGVQKGLGPAYAYQILLNGTRLGAYEPMREGCIDGLRSLTGSGREGVLFPGMVLAGATSGILGALIGSPVFLIKTRMQSYTAATAAVGHQHSYVTKGTFPALAHIYRNEGLRGLWRGADAAMLRAGVGSAVQLTGYDSTKGLLLKSGWFEEHDGQGDVRVHFAASLVTSFFVCLAMNPFDVASTRMYNQKATADGKQGTLYKNGLDCIMKTVRSEGPAALYKGFTAAYLRIGPHTVLMFVFLEQLKKLARWADTNV
ncbi:Mitochondrial oxaloacetate carrier protein [Rhizophlyctis rosea]|uniref:Mitochondrial oxaloacetate carrier protein n=1 Tax=Rhizophlyctis rosea TaxID=64517 RepID=A0AAD5SR67_9FUNG|nr:Mitochondrial oxaloacetate carrier protein [Rhizophlyctis rosea]